MTELLRVRSSEVEAWNALARARLPLAEEAGAQVRAKETHPSP